MAKRYYSARQAAKYLAAHVHFEDQSIKINKKFLKRLDEECRLLPIKRGLFGKRYSLTQLQKYAFETQPR